MRSISLLTSLALAGGVVAQGQAFTVPNGTPTGQGNCNVIPWGDAGSATWSNQRYQTIVPASDLGTPGFITGLEFDPCNTGTHNSATLKITIGMVPNNFTFAGGNTNFDVNLANAVGTTVVLDQTDYSFEMNASTWSNVGFTQSFLYDGTSDVLIDILTTGNVNTGSGSMHRNGVRERLYAINWTGTPPATGSTGLAALSMRVLMGCAELSTFGQGCAGLQLSFSGSPALGSVLTTDMAGGAATMPTALNVGAFAQNPPFPIDLSPFGLTGCSLFASSEVSASTISDATGAASISIPVPAASSLTGVRLYFQWVHLNVTAPGGAATSNGGVAVLGPQC